MIDEAIAIPIILALVEAVKRAGFPKKYLAFVAIALGVGYQLLTKGPTVDNGLMGVAIGLAASGLYSSGKAVVKK